MKYSIHQDIGRVFDELADGYTQMMEDMVPHYRTLITTMLRSLPAGFTPRRIMDLGCGNGNVTALCRVIYPEASYHLVDASAEMIQRCKDRFGSQGVQYEQAFFQNMSLPDGAYDLMVAGFSFHHVPGHEKQRLFRYLYPALSPGGVLTTADLFVNKDDSEHPAVVENWRSFVLSNGRAIDDWDWIMDHYAKYDRPSAFVDQQKWLREAGFKDIQLSWNDGPWGCFHATK